MSCRKWERCMSDFQDGELSPRRQRHLERHVAACPACRAYAERLRVIHTQSGSLEQTPLPSQQQRDMHTRLRERLRAEAGAERAPGRIHSGFEGRRAWFAAGAVTVMAAAVLVLLVLPRRESGLGEESFAFSIDETLALVFSEIGDDPELEKSFNALLAASLHGTMESISKGLGPGLDESPWLWQELTEEELRFLEEAIKKEMKS